MRRIPLIISLFCLGLLAGCSSTPRDIDAKLAAPLAPGKSRIVVYRSGMNYQSVSARIDVNDQRVLELWQGEGCVVDVPAGQTVVSADAWSDPGHYEITLNAQPGMVYTFKVAPRIANMTLDDPPDDVTSVVTENAGPFTMAFKDADKN